MNAGHHRLTLLGGLGEFGAERFDLLHGRIVFADHGFGGQLANLIDAFPVLDVVGHRTFR